MQVIMQEAIPSIMDFSRKPGSFSEKGKGGKSFASFLAASNSRSEENNKTSFDKQPLSSQKDKKDYIPEDTAQEAGGETSAAPEDTFSDYSAVLSLLTEAQPKTEPPKNQVRIMSAAPESVNTNGAQSELIALVQAQSNVSVNTAQGETVSAASIAPITDAQPIIAADDSIQLDMPEEAAIKIQVPAGQTSEGGEIMPEEKGQGRAFSVQGEGETNRKIQPDHMDEKAIRKAHSNQSPVQPAEAKGHIQGNPEAAGPDDSAKPCPSVFAGSSGGESNPGFGNTGDSGQLGAGMHVMTAKANPVQAGEAFTGRLAKVLQDQMLSRSELLTRDGTAEIRLELKPEYLGKLLVRLSLENGGVNARFVVENQQVRSLIETNITHLKQCLADQGITWQEASVDVGGSGSGFSYEDERPGTGRWNNRSKGNEELKGAAEYLPVAAGRNKNSSISYLA